MVGIRDYSTTAASNLSVGGISIAEGWARASVNNAYRAGMADTANLLLDLGGSKLTTGTASAFLVDLDSEPTAWADNMLFLATAHVGNAAGATINPNSIGAKPIKTTRGGLDLAIAAEAFPAGHIGIFTYSSAKNAVILLNSALSSAAEFDTVAEMLAWPGPADGEGTVWRADGFRYREADPAATDHHLTTAGGVKLYVQPGDDGWYNFLAMGPARDGVTNDAAKLNTLLAIRPMPVGASLQFWPQGPSIFIPSGIYYMDAGPWGFQVKAITRIMGEGHSPDNDLRNTTLRFPNDVVGFMFNHFDSFEDIQEVYPGTGGAKGSVFERLTVEAVPESTGSNPYAHGIWVRTCISIRDVTVHGFYGHGIAITGSSGTQPNPLDHGGPSGFSLENVCSFENHGHGIFVEGHDASVGYGHRIDVNNNGRWGLYENSFLGDVWIMVHSEVNGVANHGGNSAGSSSMVYINEGDGTKSIYYAKYDATPSELVTVTPGTDDSVWVILPGFYHFGGAVGTNYALWLPGQPVDTYFTGGSFWSGNSSGRNMFVCCYSEGSAPGALSPVALSIGGVAQWQVGAHYFASGNMMTTASGYGVIDADGNRITLAGDPNSSATLFRALSYRSVEEALSWIWQYSATTGDYALQYAGSQNAHFLTTINTTQKMGTSKTQPYLMQFPTLAIGNLTNTRRQTTGTAKPATGEWTAGDIVWNTSTATNSYAGWVCTTAGVGASSALAWATGTNYALNAYILATGGKYYRCSVDPGGSILSTDEPSHGSGEVVGADGYGWTFVASAALEFLPFGQTIDLFEHTTTAVLSLSALTHPRIIVHSATVSTSATISLSTSGAFKGANFRITRTGGGAGVLNVGTGPLKALAASTWCEVTYNGSAWILTAYGAL